MAYKVHENCMKAELKRLAISMCPSTCAMCCLTKQFNCSDDPASAAACTNLTVAMCNDANFQPIAIRKCPKRCGFCDRPASTTPSQRTCVDRPNCAQFTHLCNTPPYSTTLKQQCPIICRGTC
ncbi:unnamed protein product [Dracunculus medinensis]|uniref:ShTK domain protein n=1 Tax=Dracunculus medinensis TaxID=318479 RepID=A0A0N4UME3_DRAME|nr:unnamed protein product [Dracunculus medinensis]